MLKIVSLAYVTFKGGMRDRTLALIFTLSIFFFLSTPVFSSFSLRQVTAVAIDYNLSVISFFGLLLILFIGVHIIAEDIDKRSVYSVISLPFSRGQYILGKFAGLAALIFCIILILLIFAIPAIAVTQYIYPQGIVIHWSKIILAVFFIYLKLITIGAVIFLFSAVGTSTMFPLLMGIAFYFVGESTEEVLIYLKSSGEDKNHLFIKKIALFIDYIFPNLSALDLKSTAIYGLPVDMAGLTIIAIHAVAYIAILLILSIFIFQKREFL